MATMTLPPVRLTALRDYQARTLLALFQGIARHPGATFTVMFPRQAGKNETSAMLCAALLLANAAAGGALVVCAPTYDPQGRISQERTQRALSFAQRLLPEAARMRIEGNTLRCGRASAIFLSASPAAHSAGHTASIALIADEAQDIDSDWFNRQFRPMAASTGAATVLFSTPWDGRSLLETAAAANRERDRAMRGLPYRDFQPFHHQVSWEEVAATRPAYGDYVRKERERLGANHPLFLSQYELIAGGNAGRLLNEAQLTMLEGEFARQHTPRNGERYVAGLDFGGEGVRGDANVLTIARVGGTRAEVVEHIAWQGRGFSEVLREVVALVRSWRTERLCVDGTGLGAPLAAQLLRECGPVIDVTVFTSAVKSALGYALIAAANTGRLALYAHDNSPEASVCRSELRACRASYGHAGRLSWGDDRGHDDYAVSLALCLRAAEATGPARVASGRRRE
ncbi:hypothetical protein AYO38_07940 [bacterium SCGC AG-212-C10]|nr:hypothetical protein AYO38_07940 [bacterium SCGC AG-212-C10]